MVDRYYIDDRGTTVGPLDRREVLGGIASGRVTGATQVYIEGEPLGWRSISSVPAFERALRRSAQKGTLDGNPSQNPSATRVRHPRLWRIVGAAATLFCGVCVVVVSLWLFHLAAPERRRDAIVRIVTSENVTGTGAFVRGPDDWAYVATAAHVVEQAAHISIERDVDFDNGKYYVESYPEVVVAAIDVDNDLAILRLKNVRASKFQSLRLAKGAVRDEAVTSYGFPASNLAARFGMVAKQGTVLQFTKFAVLDRHNSRVLRDNAIDGLLISSEIEPGFSGGPTCNAAGEIVGVSTLKDEQHVGQNGAISVRLLRELMAKVRPLSQHSNPSAGDVATFLARIDRDMFMLPMEQHDDYRESEFLATSELPQLHRLVTAIRIADRDTQQTSDDDLSGQAALGLAFARLPGRPFATYRALATRISMQKCEEENERSLRFFGALSGVENVAARAAEASKRLCDDLAFRPLAWDIAAATLRWEGRERQWDVTRIDAVDEDAQLYRASVREKGSGAVWPIWLTLDGDVVRLKLLNKADELYFGDVAPQVPPAEFRGTWSAHRARTPWKDLGVEKETTEALSVAVGDDGVASVKHTLRNVFFAPEGKTFGCNGGPSVTVTLTQDLSGVLEQNAIALKRIKDGAQIVDDPACEMFRTDAPYLRVVLKRVDSNLVMYRTSGSLAPEAIDFGR